MGRRVTFGDFLFTRPGKLFRMHLEVLAHAALIDLAGHAPWKVGHDVNMLRNLPLA